MQIQKQPLRNCLFLFCLNSFLVLFRVSTRTPAERFIPGLYSYIYKTFQHRISFKPSAQFFVYIPRIGIHRSNWLLLYFTANFTQKCYVGCFIKSLGFPWSYLNHLNFLYFTALLSLFVMFLYHCQCTFLKSVGKYHAGKPRISQEVFY